MKRCIKNIIFCIMLVFFFVKASVVNAQNDSLKPRPIPAQLQFADLNGDGEISSGEMEIIVDKYLYDNKTYSPYIIKTLRDFYEGRYEHIHDGHLNSIDSAQILKIHNQKLLDSLANVNLVNDSLRNTINNPLEPSLKHKLGKYLSVGAEITGIYQTYTKLKKEIYDGYIGLSQNPEGQVLSLVTLSIAAKPWKGAEFLISPELASGNGVGNGAGIANYPNALYGYPQTKPYLFRLQYKQEFNLAKNEDSKVQSYNFTLGRFVIQEVLDVNPYAGNPKMDFLNFSHNMMSAWDASTTAYGWTYGFASSLVTKKGSINFCAVTVDSAAGGATPYLGVLKAHSFNLQYAQQYSIKKKSGTIRFLGFLNTALSGNYNNFVVDSSGIASFDSLVDFNNKYGFAFDADMAISEDVGLFARASWNDGKTESFGYTETDFSLNAGALLSMPYIKRPHDIVGICASYNSISKPHRNFIAKGGTGFMLGDGYLDYAPESVVEAYYSCNLFADFYLTFDYQYAVNVGYNKSRGNTSFFAFRLNVAL